MVAFSLRACVCLLFVWTSALAGTTAPAKPRSALSAKPTQKQLNKLNSIDMMVAVSNMM
jgi:hypothetical protein